MNRTVDVVSFIHFTSVSQFIPLSLVPHVDFHLHMKIRISTLTLTLDIAAADMSICPQELVQM